MAWNLPMLWINLSLASLAALSVAKIITTAEAGSFPPAAKSARRGMIKIVDWESRRS
jgi:hypothetical protein